MKLSGKVVRGQGFAMLAFGLPTANLEFDDVIALEPGTYAGYTFLGDKRYASVIYIGPQASEKCEDHLFDFSGDLYGKTLEIEIVKLVSAYVAWESEEQMKAKVADDVQKVREHFATPSSSAL